MTDHSYNERTDLYLVIGATGNVGGEVVNLLVKEGHPVRAMVRDLNRASTLPQEVDVVVGDLDDADSLAAAAKGVDAVFFMQLAPLLQQAEHMISAAHAAGVRKLVVLSSLGTRLFPPPIIGARITARDVVFRQSDLDVTYLYASGLMSNALWWLPSIKEAGRVVDPTDPGKIGVVDPYDVARVAAVVLVEDGHAGQGYVLTGPEALSPSEQTRILAEVLGRPLDFAAPTPEDVEREAVEKGEAPEMAAAMRNLNEQFRASRAGLVTDDVQNLTGTAPRTFRQWAQQHANEFH